MHTKPSIENILQYKEDIMGYVKDFFKVSDVSFYMSNNNFESDNWISISTIPEEKKFLINIITDDGKKVILSAQQHNSLDMNSKSSNLFIKSFELLLENIQLRKNLNYDLNSGSLNYQVFLKKIVSNIESVSNHLQMDSSNFRVVSDLDFLQGRFILACFYIENFQEIIQKIGINEWFIVFSKIKDRLYILSRNFYYDNNDKIYILINEKLKNYNESLLKAQTDIINHLYHLYNFLDIKIKCLYLIYPQNIPPYLFKKDYWDIAYELLQLLKKGICVIKKHNNVNLHPIPLSYIIEKYGTIEEILLDNMVKINIGEDFGVRCGQYFSIKDKKTGKTKGEVIITNTNTNSAIGEVMYLIDPFFEINKDDSLSLVYESSIEYNNKKTNLHHSIMDIYLITKDLNKFCVILVKGSKTSVKKITNLFSNKLNKIFFFENFGVDKHIILLTNTNICENDQVFLKIKRMLSDDHCSAVGITNYPLLDLKKYDIIKRSIDSLEHAELLAPPKVVIFDSVTFNLRGDRYFLTRDILSAVSEYKRAIAMDKNNHIAINSLGVCFVKLGEIGKAIELFENAYKLNKNITYSYNLGSAYFKLKKYDKAKEAYIRCHNLDPNHVFSILRLAQLFEILGDLDTAKKFYQKVNTQRYPFVLRYLAKIAITEGKHSKAKKLLEDAIRLNPEDSEAIFLLGKLYLEKFNDAEMAVTLIKKSIALRPENINYKRFLIELKSKTEKKQKK